MLRDESSALTVEASVCLMDLRYFDVSSSLLLAKTRGFLRPEFWRAGLGLAARSLGAWAASLCAKFSGPGCARALGGFETAQLFSEKVISSSGRTRRVRKLNTSRKPWKSIFLSSRLSRASTRAIYCL